MHKVGSVLLRSKDYPCRQTGLRHTIILTDSENSFTILSETGFIYEKLDSSIIQRLFINTDSIIDINENAPLEEVISSLNKAELSKQSLQHDPDTRTFQIPSNLLNELALKKSTTNEGNERNSGIHLIEEIMKIYPTFGTNIEYLKLRNNLFEDIRAREHSFKTKSGERFAFTAILYDNRFLTSKYLKQLKDNGIEPENMNPYFKNILNWVFKDNSWQVEILIKRAYYNVNNKVF